jgi:integrase/recombinase XerD
MTPLRQRMIEDMQIRNLSPHTQRVCGNRGPVCPLFRPVPGAARARGNPRVPGVFDPGEKAGAQFPRHRGLFASLPLQSHAQAHVGVRRHHCRPPKKPVILPMILSAEEVVHFLASVPHPAHRTILTTCYATGLRISEAVRLTAPALDSQRMVLRVEDGKGHQDRYVMLSPKLLAILREWWRVHRAAALALSGQGPGATPHQSRGAKNALHSR